MRFHDVKHQLRALSILRRALESGRTHHAYLFDGPAGVGKERVARALAAKLLCENVPGSSGFQAGFSFGGDEATADEFEPCGDCRSCKLLAADNHPDFHFVDRTLHRMHPDPRIRKSKGLSLVVDVVRHFLIEPACKTPALGRRRVFVMRDAERMNEEASNALLKTLEEPPGEATLILITSAASRLLPTIRSRCQRIPFDLLPAAFVRERLAEAGVKSDDAAMLAGLSQGSLGDALQLHRIAAGELVERVVALLAQGGYASVEVFGKALVELGGEIAERIAEAERAADAERTSSGERTAGGEQTASAARPSSTARAANAERGGDSRTREDAGEIEDAAAEADAGDADAVDGDASTGKSSKSVETDALRGGLRIALQFVAVTLRDALLAHAAAASGGSAGGASRILPPRMTGVSAIASTFGESELIAGIESVSNTERMIDRNVAPQLSCEWLAAALNRAVPA